MYVFRMDGGVFGTEMPGPLLDLAGQPRWLDSVASREWRPDRPLVSPARHRRCAAAQPASGGRYLRRHSVRAVRPAGAAGGAGEHAGPLRGSSGRVHHLPRLARAGSRPHDQPGAAPARAGARAGPSLAVPGSGAAPDAVAGCPADPGRPPLRSRERIEHQAEAVAFAVHFLQATAVFPDGRRGIAAGAVRPAGAGTGAMARYLALQPIYAGHPLRRMLTTGERS